MLGVVLSLTFALRVVHRPDPGTDDQRRLVHPTGRHDHHPGRAGRPGPAHHPGHRAAAGALGYAFFGMGLLLFLLVISLLHDRLVLAPAAPAPLAPTLWIALAPSASPPWP